MQKQNYDIKMQNIVEKLKKREKLLLHSCCGPCSSSVIERLAQYFDITIAYTNDNIWPEEEYVRRGEEQKQLLENKQFGGVSFVEIAYLHKDFLAAAKGCENEPEGGVRCEACFRLRLEKSAEYAINNGFNWFATTLSVSPHKNAEKLNSIGEDVARRHGVDFLVADFKKRNGYKRSVELSEEYGLYRQDYCGCEFSRAARHKLD